MGTEYDRLADIYDVWTDSAPITRENGPFYVEECVRESGSVVELGVGNGRIALEAAKRGKSMIGVDDSRAMLDLCRQRAREAGVSDRIALIEADFRDFDLPEPASLITIPFHSIGHLLSLDDKRDCLRHVHDQLAPGGRLIFDHFVFDPAHASRAGTPQLRAEYTDRSTGRDSVLWVCTGYDHDRQRLRVLAFADELDAEGIVLRRRYFRFDLSWIEPEQARHLLEETGFRVEAVYGGFDRRPLEEDSPSQVWVARRPG